MRRIATWPIAFQVIVTLSAIRVVWLAWFYYMRSGPRYPLESAVMLFVALGVSGAMLRRRDRPVDPPVRVRIPSSYALIFIAASVSVYAPALWLGLLSDDYVLKQMARVGSLGIGEGWFFRPLPLMAWKALLSVGDSAVPLHLLNLVLHGVNAFFVARLGAALGMRRESAIAAAAVFLTFPAGPEAVAWASGVQDVMMTTMALGAVVASMEIEHAGWRTAAVSGLTILALTSKETAICVPALIAIVTIGVRPRRRALVLTGVTAALTGCYVALRLSMGIRQGFVQAPSRYFVKQLIVNAFGALAIPFRAPASAGAALLPFLMSVVIVCLLAGALMTWRREDEALITAGRLALFCLATVAPVFTYFFVSPQLEGARYVYFAEGAWALWLLTLTSAATQRLRRPREVLLCVAAALVAVQTVTLRSELREWAGAAALRDRVLAGASAAIAAGGCASARFTDVPDSVEGAYVFRNGFAEAIGQAGAPAAHDPRCAFRWNGERFVVSTPGR